MDKKLAAAVAVVLTLGLCTASAQGTGTVLDGVYTTEQAARGQRAYGDSCMACHEGIDQDGPDLKGSAFVDRWRGDRLEVLFTQISTRMPGNRPGGLSENTYVDILAFLLEGNGFPAGSRELTADVIKSVQLVGKDGPKPLPNLTVVRVVGCLTSGPNDTWILTNASEPVRSRSINETTPEELKSSAASPLGAQKFRLQNVAAGASADQRSQSAGQRRSDQTTQQRPHQRDVARDRCSELWAVSTRGEGRQAPVGRHQSTSPNRSGRHTRGPQFRQVVDGARHSSSWHRLPIDAVFIDFLERDALIRDKSEYVITAVSRWGSCVVRRVAKRRDR